ncbi:siderophore-interacting protein [Phyllobacterium sp. 0TCS1.6A]|uniref:siderophore-interacting protein n=1 Tax=Phyllobacterium sp. 0TCS1.6A TaxID=2995637 RepID=UPI002263E08F|nr:siderophore-interacting protein [Phyllobacterium sp. 0TCS1.6A]MCX8293246.1 siderophore-interacting protein [Phyllobacterium sp. 0TCS1.6A]
MTLMNKSPQRIRHETRLRILEVVSVRPVTPLMLRITLGGDDLEGFASPGHGDHIKVFFPQAGEDIIVPVLGPEGLTFPAGVPRPEMRDYTPRYHDPRRRTLDVDFVLHGDGPASTWAAQARVGQKIVIGGPRGSLIVPDDFDWYLLAGDETALPAIGRRLEELPSTARAIAFIEVAGKDEEQVIRSSASVDIHWLHRDGQEPGNNGLLLDAIKAAELPDGDCYAFIAGESSMSKAVRAHLVSERSFKDEWIKAAGYWLRGVADAHEPH